MESGVGMPHGGYFFIVPSAFLCCVNSLRLKSSTCSCMMMTVRISTVSDTAMYSTFEMSSQKFVLPGSLYSHRCHRSLNALTSAYRFRPASRALVSAIPPADLAAAAPRPARTAPLERAWAIERSVWAAGLRFGGCRLSLNSMDERAPSARARLPHTRTHATAPPLLPSYPQQKGYGASRQGCSTIGALVDNDRRRQPASSLQLVRPCDPALATTAPTPTPPHGGPR